MFNKKFRALAINFVVALAIFLAGGFIGVLIHKKQMQSNAFAYWMTGLDYLEKGERDYALLYISGAVALRSDPMFYESLGDVYMTQNNAVMALQAYKLAIDGYKKEQAGPFKSIEKKIEQLQGQLSKQEGRTK